MATRAETNPPARNRQRFSAASIERIASFLILAGVVAAIVVGWLHRHDTWLDPEHGLGYALGIIGGVLMIVLLAYPVRKRVKRSPRSIGSVGFWFRLHMLLGLLGPLAILYHSRFTWGALNSAFALGAMIVVASSGLVGRYFYSRVHRGFSGRKLELRALKQEMESHWTAMVEHGLPREALLDRLQPLESRAIAAGANFWASAGAVVGLALETRRVRRAIQKQMAVSASDYASVRALLDDYFEAVRRTAEFAFFDRLLRLWHLLHLPLFILLVAAAILHIIAVHMY